MDEQPATTTPKDEKHSVNWGALILWPAVILLLYVFSFGPVGMMTDKGFISYTHYSLWKFYEPLNWAYVKTPLHKPLGMYFHLWQPETFDKNWEPQRSK